MSDYSKNVPREIIFVTGAAGFMGSHLVDYLVSRGHKVFAVTICPGDIGVISTRRARL